MIIIMQDNYLIYKKDIIKKIINTKIHTIGKQGIIMNKYKFSEELSEKTKSVTSDIILQNGKEEVLKILKKYNDAKIILMSDSVKLLERGEFDESLIENVDVKNINNYFSYPVAFSESELEKFQSEIIEVIREIDGFKFAEELVNIKKVHAVKNFNIEEAIKYNDNISTLKNNMNKLKENLRGILLRIKIIEDDFVDNFNMLVVDVKNKHLNKNTTLEYLNENYTKEVVKEYKLQSIVNLILKTFSYDSTVVMAALENDMEFSTVLGDDYTEIVTRFKNVGANI